ncbi:MAG: carboxyl transferase domain-containing protein, partial [Clostridia bacterium]|nr:carboxyl transferase domain-containing protein [Clostridia bacterium]
DIAFALDRAAISVLPPESAVAFVWNDRVGGSDPKASREELEEQWKEICASPADAAEKGEIDDIIENIELRQRICASVLMLASKSEIYPDRRHAVLPL